MSHQDGVSTAPAPQHVAPSKLIGTLTGYGAIAGLLIVLAFQWAQPRIDAYKASELNAALKEVMGDPQTIKSLFLYQGSYTDSLPAGTDTTALERVFAGWNAEGTLIGYAITGAEPGFADVVTVLFAYDPSQKQLIGMKVLDNKETPGLGDKIVKDSVFVSEFKGVVVPMVGVKRGAGKGGSNEIDMITGVTISSRTVIGIINRKLERTLPLLPKEARP